MFSSFGLGRLGLLQRWGGGGAFSPLSLSPTAWYDPSDLSTLFQDSGATTPVTADGDVVGYIGDKSGNGYHLTQGTTANKPLYKTSGGLHWLQYDGVDDYLSVAFASGSFPADCDMMLANQRATGNTVALAMAHNSPTFIGAAADGAATAPDAGIGAPGPSYLINGVAVPNGTAATRNDLYDAWPVDTNNVMEVEGATCSVLTGLVIDNYSTFTGLRRVYGFVAAEALTDEEKTALRAYLSGKAGI